MATKGKKPSVTQAVAYLVDAFSIGNLLPGLPETCRPRTLAEAYAVQAALVETLGIQTAGWKIGCTSEVARAIFKTDRPFAGRVFLPRCFVSGSRIPGNAYPVRGVEGEFAFFLGKNLKPRKKPYSRAEVLAAVEGLHLAIEIVDTRYEDRLKVTLPEIVADLGINGALVVGPPVKGWRRRDLGAVGVTMRAGGKVVGKGKGADALGHPLESLRWLANNPATKEGLSAGEIVTTGTCTGLHQAGPRDKVSCDFGPLGKVTFAFV